MGIFLLIVCSMVANAKILGEIPSVERGEPGFHLITQSDTWDRPNQNKESPMRGMEGKLFFPMSINDNWELSAGFLLQAHSVGRPNITLGENNTPIQNDFRTESVGFSSEYSTVNSKVFFYFFHESSSDAPFKRTQDIYNQYGLKYSANFGQNSKTILGFDVDKNRGYLNYSVLPILGVEISLLENIEIHLGFPFIIYSHKIADNELYIKILPNGYTAQLKKVHSQYSDLIVRTGNRVVAYFLSASQEEEMRVYFDEKYLEFGFEYKLTDQSKVGATVGGTQDRKLYQAKQVFMPIGESEYLNNDAYIRTYIEYRFL